MANPEAAYTYRINREAKLEVYAWKISDRFTAGVPDCWYSGPRGDLWVEFKWMHRFPKNRPVKADLSPRQIKWLTDRHDEGRNVAVVVASPDGAVIYHHLNFLKPKYLKDVRVYKNFEVVNFIVAETRGCLHPEFRSTSLPT